MTLPKVIRGRPQWSRKNPGKEEPEEPSQAPRPRVLSIVASDEALESGLSKRLGHPSTNDWHEAIVESDHTLPACLVPAVGTGNSIDVDLACASRKRHPVPMNTYVGTHCISAQDIGSHEHSLQAGSLFSSGAYRWAFILLSGRYELPVCGFAKTGGDSSSRDDTCMSPRCNSIRARRAGPSARRT